MSSDVIIIEALDYVGSSFKKSNRRLNNYLQIVDFSRNIDRANVRRRTLAPEHGELWIMAKMRHALACGFSINALAFARTFIRQRTDNEPIADTPGTMIRSH